VRVGKQQVPSNVVLLGDPLIAGEPGEEPDPPALAERTGRLVDRAAFADDAVHESKRILVLDGNVALADDADRLPAVHPDDAESAGDRLVEGARGEELDPPVEPGGLDGLGARGRVIERDVQAVPGALPDEHHRFHIRRHGTNSL